jgi:hypothetical protein
LGIKHVKDTISESLKKALVDMLSDHGLVVANIRGQGYDSASNMRREFNGIQKLIGMRTILLSISIVLLINCNW